MTKRFTDNEIWSKDWFLNLDDKQKLLTKFIFDNCDCAGVYEISWRMLKIFFTSDITREDFEKIKQVRFLDDNTIFVEDFVNFQCSISSINELNPNNNAHKGIIKRLKKYGLYLGANEGLNRGSIAPQEKEKEILIEKDINKPINKVDKYNNVYIDAIKKEFKKVFNQTPLLVQTHLDKILELSEEIPNFLETIPETIQKLKRVDFSEIGYNAKTLSWLLKDNHYVDVYNGTWDFETKEEVFERLKAEEMERRKQNDSVDNRISAKVV